MTSGLGGVLQYGQLACLVLKQSEQVVKLLLQLSRPGGELTLPVAFPDRYGRHAFFLQSMAPGIDLSIRTDMGRAALITREVG